MGVVGAENEQDVFTKLNVEDHSFPRSMSVGDVVREENGTQYLMCWFSGWRPVDEGLSSLGGKGITAQ
jgi:hypothetical protein